MAANPIENTIIQVGNYLLIKRLGLNDVYFSKKNTVMNVTPTNIVLTEANDGGTINIDKAQIDASKWGTEAGFVNYEEIITYLVENTGNFSTAAGGSAAKFFKARIFLGPIPYVITNFEDGIGLENAEIVRSAVGSYEIGWTNELIASKMRLLPVPLSNVALAFGTIYGPTTASFKVTDYTGQNIDPYQSMELTIEYFG